MQKLKQQGLAKTRLFDRCTPRPCPFVEADSANAFLLSNQADMYVIQKFRNLQLQLQIVSK
jgi:hypothetical protein